MIHRNILLSFSDPNDELIYDLEYSVVAGTSPTPPATSSSAWIDFVPNDGANDVILPGNSSGSGDIADSLSSLSLQSYGTQTLDITTSSAYTDALETYTIYFKVNFTDTSTVAPVFQLPTFITVPPSTQGPTINNVNIKSGGISKNSVTYEILLDDWGTMNPDPAIDNFSYLVEVKNNGSNVSSSNVTTVIFEPEQKIEFTIGGLNPNTMYPDIDFKLTAISPTGDRFDITAGFQSAPVFTTLAGFEINTGSITYDIGNNNRIYFQFTLTNSSLLDVTGLEYAITTSRTVPSSGWVNVTNAGSADGNFQTLFDVTTNYFLPQGDTVYLYIRARDSSELPSEPSYLILDQFPITNNVQTAIEYINFNPGLSTTNSLHFDLKMQLDGRSSISYNITDSGGADVTDQFNTINLMSSQEQDLFTTIPVNAGQSYSYTFNMYYSKWNSPFRY